MYGIEQFGKGHFITASGSFDASIMDTEEDGVWLIPYDESDVMFVAWDDISGFAQDTYGSYALDEAIRKHYYENR